MAFSNFIEQASSAKLIDKLRAFGTSKLYGEGDILLQEDSYIKAIPIVIKGNIKVIRTSDDIKEILLYYIQPGESCIMSFLGGVHNETSKVKAVAAENTEVLFIPTEKIKALIKEWPEMLDYIFRLYHARFEELLEVVNAVAFQKVDERLLDFLKKKAALTKTKTLQITHEQIALELGTARVVVSRLLRQMEQENILKLGRNKIELL